MRSMAVRTNHIASVTDKLPSSKSSTTRRLRRSIASMTDRLPSSKELDRFGTNGMLALIHDAIGHLITQVSSVPKVMPVLQQVAEALLKQQAFLEEVLAVRRDAVLDHFAAGKVEEMFSLSHSVIGRDLRFVSASEPYCTVICLNSASPNCGVCHSRTFFVRRTSHDFPKSSNRC
jgi:hypothetical protein